MRMRAPKEGSCDPIAPLELPLELPHSLHAVHRVSPTDDLNMVCSLHCFEELSKTFLGHHSAFYQETAFDIRAKSSSNCLLEPRHYFSTLSN